jgi:hypothetical protein
MKLDSSLQAVSTCPTSRRRGLGADRSMDVKAVGRESPSRPRRRATSREALPCGPRSPLGAPGDEPAIVTARARKSLTML